MLGLVLSPTYLQMFIFWELVGLCSYLLIGFWYTRPAAARAAVKAFWTTKLGDLGFIAGVVMLWSCTGTFDFETLFRMAKDQTLPVDGLATIMFLIYLGAMGKSAQFPLHVWLSGRDGRPDPVSALIHAATMVTAGVFLVARSEPLFVLVPGVLRVDRADRRLHGAARRHHGVRRTRHQAGPRVLHGLAARLHDGGGRRGRERRGPSSIC